MNDALTLLSFLVDMVKRYSYVIVSRVTQSTFEQIKVFFGTEFMVC